MVALRPTAGVTLSGLVNSVLMPPGAGPGQIHVIKTLFPDPSPRVARACVTWTAPSQAAHLSSVFVTDNLPAGEGRPRGPACRLRGPA
jgi:hypothetical protein